MYRIGIRSKTSTGGEVIEGNSSILFDGLVASSVGHMTTCKACKKGIGPIVGVGRRDEVLPAGPAARSGDYVACGSQNRESRTLLCVSQYEMLEEIIAFFREECCVNSNCT